LGPLSTGIAFAQGSGLPEAMPANAKTFLLRNGHSRKEEFERAANPPSGIASGVPLPGAKTRWVFIPLWILSHSCREISGGQAEHPLMAAVLPLRARNAAIRGCSACQG
jgi:hypothetical protein